MKQKILQLLKLRNRRFSIMLECLLRKAETTELVDLEKREIHLLQGRRKELNALTARIEGTRIVVVDDIDYWLDQEEDKLDNVLDYQEGIKNERKNI